MRLFRPLLSTCLGNPFFASLSIHGLHFAVYAASICCWRHCCWRCSLFCEPFENSFCGHYLNFCFRKRKIAWETNTLWKCELLLLFSVRLLSLSLSILSLYIYIYISLSLSLNLSLFLIVFHLLSPIFIFSLSFIYVCFYFSLSLSLSFWETLCLSLYCSSSVYLSLSFFLCVFWPVCIHLYLYMFNCLVFCRFADLELGLRIQSNLVIFSSFLAWNLRNHLQILKGDFEVVLDEHDVSCLMQSSKRFEFYLAITLHPKCLQIMWKQWHTLHCVLCLVKPFRFHHCATKLSDYVLFLLVSQCAGPI